MFRKAVKPKHESKTTFEPLIKEVMLALFTQYDLHIMKIMPEEQATMYSLNDNIQLEIFWPSIKEYELLNTLFTQAIIDNLTDAQKATLKTYSDENIIHLAALFATPLLAHMTSNIGKTFHLEFSMMLIPDKKTYLVTRTHSICGAQLDPQLLKAAVAEPLVQLQKMLDEVELNVKRGPGF